MKLKVNLKKVLALITIFLAASYQPGIAVNNDIQGIGSPSNGQNLFLAYCFICHGANGKGNGPYSFKLSKKPRDFSDSDYFSARSDEDLYSVISKGGPPTGKSQHMRPWGFRLTSMDMTDLVAYIRFLGRPDERGFKEIEGISSKELYVLYCVSCHGDKGDGEGVLVKYLPNKAASLGAKDLMSKKTDKMLYRSIAGGKKNDLNPNESYMPAYRKSLSDEQIRGLISYIRNTLSK